MIEKKEADVHIGIRAIEQKGRVAKDDRARDREMMALSAKEAGNREAHLFAVGRERHCKLSVARRAFELEHIGRGRKAADDTAHGSTAARATVGDVTRLFFCFGLKDHSKPHRIGSRESTVRR